MLNIKILYSTVNFVQAYQNSHFFLFKYNYIYALIYKNRQYIKMTKTSYLRPPYFQISGTKTTTYLATKKKCYILNI